MLGDEGGALVNGISVLIIETLEIPLFLPSCKFTKKRRPPRKWASPDTESTGTMILDMSAYRSVRNKILVVYK